MAFDEGWYLLLGRNLWSGDGYTLTGLQHVALSPLFPMLAGAVDRVLGDPIWAGRLVAAVSSGLLVIPCWGIFRCLAGRQVACVGALFVAAMPALAPFVVPYWIGWDLWVGAEPLLHLFLYSGIALSLRAWTLKDWVSGLGAGAALGLAYLARPEAIIAFGILGLTAIITAAVARYSRLDAPPLPILASRAGGCAIVFLVLAAPYWTYLHDSLGRWTITGRAVQLIPEVQRPRIARRETTGPNRIEMMLWEGDSSPYVQRLYALNSSATALANGYWGVPVPDAGAAPVSSGPNQPGPSRAGGPLGVGADSAPRQSAGNTANREAPVGSIADQSIASSDVDIPDDAPSPWLLRYAQALGVVAPWYLWIFAIAGLAAPGRMLDRRRRLELELLVALPLVATSMLIARAVAIDPRTQLFLAPLVAFYAARGVLVVGRAIKERLGDRVRRDLPTRLLVGSLVLVLLGTSVVRLVMSLTVGSPHHVVAAQNAEVGEAIRESTPPDATVMSFHPALALFADRDWRVLPLEPMDRIVRYARTQPNLHLVLSVFYPPEVRPAEEPHYLIVPVPEDLPEGDRWRIDIPEMRTIYAFGELAPVE